MGNLLLQAPGWAPRQDNGVAREIFRELAKKKRPGTECAWPFFESEVRDYWPAGALDVDESAAVICGTRIGTSRLGHFVRIS